MSEQRCDCHGVPGDICPARKPPTVGSLMADTPGRQAREVKGRAAGHATQAARGANVGSTELIKKCLKQYGALNQTQIADYTGVPFTTVKSLISMGISYGGCFVAFDKKKGHTRYTLHTDPLLCLPKNVDEPVGEFALALSRDYDAKPKELRRNPFEHRDLCMVTRR